jgi:hypothetical protein
MQVHGLFPTLLLQAEHNEKERIREIVLNTIMKHVNADGYSDESTGHVTIHHDPMYEPIFVMASELAVKYCEVMKIDPDLFDFQIVKSWFNIIKDRATPFHSHADAHLSFVYYVNVPEDCAQPIQFYADNDKYEPFPGFVKFNNPAEWNPFNSYAWMFPALEGTMYLWPARMSHDTIGKTNEFDPGIKSSEDAKYQRVAIAGDILLTYKEKATKPLGLQPKRNWKTFTTNPLP